MTTKTLSSIITQVSYNILIYNALITLCIYFTITQSILRLFSRRIHYLSTSSKLLAVRGLTSFSRSPLRPILKEMNTVINSSQHETVSSQEFMVDTLVSQSVSYRLHNHSDSNLVQIFVIVTQFFILVHKKIVLEEAAVYSPFDLTPESGTDHILTLYSPVAPTGQW